MSDMPFRTTYWIPLGIFIVTSSVLYIRILTLIFKKRNTQQYSSFFYKMFFISGLFDLLAVFWYVTAQWIYVDQIFCSQFLLDISHDNIPNLFYYYVFYFLYAQIFTITLVSANRVYAIHFPMSRVLATCDQFRTIILLFATMMFPIIITINFFFQANVEFRHGPNGTVGRWVSLDTTRAKSIHGMVTVSVFNIFSAICYLFVIRKLAQLNRDHGRDLSASRKWRREIALTIAFLLASIRDLNIVHYFAMAFVNPWMLLITNGSIRKKKIAGNKEEALMDISASRRDMLGQDSIMLLAQTDYLSRIPEDCIRHICKSLDRGDLDTLSMCSQRWYYLSKVGWTAARKSEAVELTIFKTFEGDRYVDLVRRRPHASQCFKQHQNGLATETEYNGCKPYDGWMCDYKPSNIDLSFVVSQAAHLMKRYMFHSVCFTSVLIDEHFIKSVKEVWCEKCMKDLKLENCSVVDPRGSGIGKRMLNLFLTLKPAILRLIVARGIIKEIDEEFLCNYARVVRYPQLHAKSTTKKPFAVDKSFASTLASFDILILDRLLVDANWIVPAIQVRLKRQTYGILSCSITRILHRMELLDQLEQGFKYINVEGRYVIRLVGTDFYADIRTTDGKPCRLYATFTQHDGKENNQF